MTQTPPLMARSSAWCERNIYLNLQWNVIGRQLIMVGAFVRVVCDIPIASSYYKLGDNDFWNKCEFVWQSTANKPKPKMTWSKSSSRNDELFVSFWASFRATCSWPQNTGGFPSIAGHLCCVWHMRTACMLCAWAMSDARHRCKLLFNECTGVTLISRRLHKQRDHMQL